MSEQNLSKETSSCAPSNPATDSEKPKEDDENVFYDGSACIAKERQLSKTLRTLEAMLNKLKDHRRKLNFEMKQLMTLMEMARGGECEMAVTVPVTSAEDKRSANSPVDPLLILDRLYNGEFCRSEEEEEDEDDEEEEEFRGRDDFGADSVEW